MPWVARVHGSVMSQWAAGVNFDYYKFKSESLRVIVNSSQSATYVS